MALRRSGEGTASGADRVVDARGPRPDDDQALVAWGRGARLVERGASGPAPSRSRTSRPQQARGIPLVDVQLVEEGERLIDGLQPVLVVLIILLRTERRTHCL